MARAEHAWLLRAEGLSFAAIGRRLGVSRTMADMLVWKFGNRMSAAMRRPAKRINLVRSFAAGVWE